MPYYSSSQLSLSPGPLCVPYSSFGSFLIPNYQFSLDSASVPNGLNYSSYNGFNTPSIVQQQSFNALADITTAALQFNDKLMMNAESWERSMGLTDLDLELVDMDFDSLGFDDLDFSFNI